MTRPFFCRQHRPSQYRYDAKIVLLIPIWKAYDSFYAGPLSTKRKFGSDCNYKLWTIFRENKPILIHHRRTKIRSELPIHFFALVTYKLFSNDPLVRAESSWVSHKAQCKKTRLPVGRVALMLFYDTFLSWLFFWWAGKYFHRFRRPIADSKALTILVSNIKFSSADIICSSRNRQLTIRKWFFTYYDVIVS